MSFFPAFERVVNVPKPSKYYLKTNTGKINTPAAFKNLAVLPIIIKRKGNYHH